MSHSAYAVRLTALADCDFLNIMEWSAAQFGDAAAERYETLIGQTLIDLGDDPFRPGAKQRPELPRDMYVYHLASSRERVAGDRVKAPRHFLLYRVAAVQVEVLRILHDSRDLARHLPDEET